MKIDRRNILKLGAVQLASLLLSRKTQASIPNVKTPLKNRPSILQGATDESQTQFSILYHTDTQLNVFVTDINDVVWSPDKIQKINFNEHTQIITKAFFSGLKSSETYFLNITNTQTGLSLDRREFQTLKLTHDGLRFALCSCMDDQFHKADIWQDLIDKNPQIIFFLGDHVYADHGAPLGATPNQLWKRFCEARQTLDIFFAPRLIPILATWDDHDFGLNNSNSENYPYVKKSQVNFLSFFAQDESHCLLLQRGPGVSSAFRWDSQLFVLLDDRSFRKAKKSKDRYAHWGEEQEKWMLNLIKKNPGPVWIMNGSQIFPQSIFQESVSRNHHVQFEGLMAELNKISSKIVFASGDVHYSEISKIEKNFLGYETYEITSSSIHSKNTPGGFHVIPNSRRIAGTNSRNFIIVNSNVVDNCLKIAIDCYNPSDNCLFHLDLCV